MNLSSRNVLHLIANVKNQKKNVERRFLSVRELPWCAPSDSPVRRGGNQVQKETSSVGHSRPILANTKDPIDRFGVVAAMSKNRVIGMNGDIPWPRLAEDRKIFKDLTRDGVLIMGRKTFLERPDQRHINHARHSIVVSKTIKKFDDDDGSCKIHTVGTFDDALDCAKCLVDDLEPKDTSSEKGLLCWVVGGEKIYDEALRHPSVEEVHLSIVDTDIDFGGANRTTDIARFPAKYRWDKDFVKISQEEFTGCNDSNDRKGTHAFTYSVFKRRRRGG